MKRIAAATPGTADPKPADGTPPDDAQRDEDLARYAKALGHPTRVRILRLLAKRTTCAYGDIADSLPLAQSTVSQHLAILRDAGLVRGTWDGPRVCYCADPDGLRALRTLVSGL